MVILRAAMVTSASHRATQSLSITGQCRPIRVRLARLFGRHRMSVKRGQNKANGQPLASSRCHEYLPTQVQQEIEIIGVQVHMNRERVPA